MRSFLRFFWSETVHTFFGARIAGMPAVPSDALIRPATPADAAAVADAFPRVPFDKRLEDGDSAFLAFVDGRLAHQSWISSSNAFIPQVRYDRRLAPDEIYFYDCVTLDSHRGRGLYPATLAAAARAFLGIGRTRAVLGVLTTNQASLRGVKKAGFAEEFNHHFYKCCGVAWAEEKPAR